MSKLMRWCALCLGALLFGLVPGTVREAEGLTFTTDEPDERADRLAGHWRLILPEGPGPHPAAILMSGCDGVRDNMDYWAEYFVGRGRAALIVDSHAPRNLDRLEAWRLVCAGLAMTGSERAGDIAVALQALEARGDIAGDALIFGASHGGWAAMEFVAHAVRGEVPPGLSGWPAPPDMLLGGVSALVLLYPYCGVLNEAVASSWLDAPPTLMILAANDSVINTPRCIARADALRESGSVVEMTVIPDADHGFDQRDKSLLSTLAFRPDQRLVARTAVTEFLDRHGL